MSIIIEVHLKHLRGLNMQTGFLHGRKLNPLANDEGRSRALNHHPGVVTVQKAFTCISCFNYLLTMHLIV